MSKAVLELDITFSCASSNTEHAASVKYTDNNRDKRIFLSFNIKYLSNTVV